MSCEKLRNANHKLRYAHMVDAMLPFVQILH